MLKINEIFDSIQGEGIHVGRLTTFVRLQGCNLNCSWCDTPLAIALEGGRAMSEDAVASEVFHPLVTITGGEPLAQDIRKLCQALRLAKCEVHIETNGTITPAADIASAVNFWTVSPKRGQDSLTAKTLRALINQYGAQGQIKFVIRTNDVIDNYNDLKWANAFVAPLSGSGWPVVIQPCWQDPAIAAPDKDKYAKRYKQMAYAIKQHWPSWDVRLIPQMHKILALDRNCHKTINRPKKDD